MSEEWFYAKGDQEFGPFSAAQMKRLGASGHIAPSDLVWKAGTARRVPARAVKGLCPEPSRAEAPSQPAAAPAAAPEEELVELLPVEAPAAPTQAIVNTQVEEFVELIPAEPITPAAPLAQAPPAPPPLPQAAPVLRGIPVAEVARPEPYEREPYPRRGRPRRRPQGGGSLLWLWLLLGGLGLVALVGAILLIILLARGSAQLTQENYNRILPGMTEAQVTDILGPADMTATLGPLRVLSWRSGTDRVDITLQGGRVVGKQGMFRNAPPGGAFP